LSLYSYQSEAQNVPRINTAEEIGREYGVSHMTVKRDAQFSQDVVNFSQKLREVKSVLAPF